MQDYRYRVAGIKGEPYTDWWWLADRVNDNRSALVFRDGSADGYGASYSIGVRPAFVAED